jgi:hypothetical protein
LAIDSEVSSLCIQDSSNIFTFEPFADKEGLAEEMHITMFRDLTEEGNSASRNGKWIMWNEIVERQFAQFGSAAMLYRSQAVQTRLHMLRIDSLFQALQFAFERAELRIVSLE